MREKTRKYDLGHDRVILSRGRYHMHTHRMDAPKDACASQGLQVPDHDIVIGHVRKTHLKAATPLPGVQASLRHQLEANDQDWA